MLSAVDIALCVAVEPERTGMGYVVKAVSASRAELWVSPPRQETHSIFGVRREALVFRTPMQAQAVIEALAEQCKRYGFLLEVDSTDDELLSAGQTTLPRLLHGSPRKSSS
jgi:hypothetical protein